MKQSLLFLQLFLSAVCFAQTPYKKGDIYKIDDNLSLICGPGVSVVTLSDVNEPPRYEYNNLSEEEVHSIEKMNFNYNIDDIFKAFKDTFSTDEINRLGDDVDIFRIGFVFNKDGRCKYLVLVFPKFSPNLMSITPQRYGMLYKNLLKVPFRVVDKRIEYNGGTVKIQMKDLQQSITQNK